MFKQKTKTPARMEIAKVSKLTSFMRILSGISNHSVATEECSTEKEMGIYQTCLFEMERDRALVIEHMRFNTVK